MIQNFIKKLKFIQFFTQNFAPAASARTAASLYLASSRVKDTASNAVFPSTLGAPNVENEALQLLDAGLQMSDMALEAMIASHMAAGQNEAADDRFGAGATVGRRHSHSVIAAHELRNIQHQVLLMCC